MKYIEGQKNYTESSYSPVTFQNYKWFEAGKVMKYYYALASIALYSPSGICIFPSDTIRDKAAGEMNVLPVPVQHFHHVTFHCP